MADGNLSNAPHGEFTLTGGNLRVNNSQGGQNTTTQLTAEGLLTSNSSSISVQSADRGT